MKVKPYYQEDGITIYHGDCRDILPNLEPVDLVLTDPPYGAGKDFAGDNMDDIELSNLWRYVFDAINCHNLLVEVPKNKNFYWDVFDSWKYEYCLSLITSNAMRIGKVGYNDFSLCLWFSRNGGKLYKRYKDGIVVSFENTRKAFCHPSPKQVKHYLKLIEMFSQDSVVDPFMGSGTTLVAAKQLGRKAIGIEIEERYCQIAVDRLRQGVLGI